MTEKCKVQQCDRDVLAKDLCGKHYQRNAKYGDPQVTRHATTDMSTEERLRFHGWTVTPNGCWEWKGSRFPKGYGRIVIDDISLGVHRVSYETFVGPIPQGLLIRHACDNPPCMNPQHLVPGTSQDNTNDRIARGRSNAQSGDTHYNIKITDTMASIIKIRYSAGGVTMKQLASEYGVSNQTICNAVHRPLDEEAFDAEAEESVDG